jgi:hypothetical protein
MLNCFAQSSLTYRFSQIFDFKLLVNQYPILITNNYIIMQLAILKSASLGDTQDAFHAAFPYLKIVFFTRTHKEHGGSNAKFMVTDRSKLLGDLSGFKAEGLLSIEPHMRTWEVERRVEEETGLHIQVFRKSGTVWLETSVSDDLTLEQQNEKAREQEEYQPPIADPMDYREQL